MIKKIILKNFLAHAYTEIELGSGMTVLTGPNNSGKSSVVEALRCIATNPLPKHFVRHGAKVARVELEMDDGTKVAWIRKKATAWYEVTKPGADEHETYAKFGRKPPEDVMAILRLNQVPLEGDKSLDVHIGDQRKPIFLLDQPASVAAQFFASSSEASHLLAMQTELKNRVKSAKREKKFQQEKMVHIASELNDLQDLPNVNLELESARELKGHSEKILSEIPRIEDLLNRKTQLQTVKEALAAREKSLCGLAKGPDLFPVKPLEQTGQQLESFSRQKTSLKKRSQSLESLAPLPQLFPVKDLDSRIAHHKQLSLAENIQNKRRNSLSLLASPPVLDDISALSATISNLSRNKVSVENISHRARVLEPIAPAPELFEDANLIKIIRNIDSLKKTQELSRVSLQKLEESRIMLEAKIKKRLAEIGSCPLCGNELAADKLIGEVVHES
ncbi:exonuclease SbcC [Maridesulfovibrio ferrireducens]|uniref:DNA repair protein RecN n=1 Tax=Maridesulfovibrio ferrireducens TaxID=246191 RepID=A0A1G9BYL5_9BACT|nr:AAA family ATPase [Maridesulfovibrio ferrireducens]SDK44490.1 exonuclease SbcC [Maridesulfovibrio ferrireducens]